MQIHIDARTHTHTHTHTQVDGTCVPKDSLVIRIRGQRRGGRADWTEECNEDFPVTRDQNCDLFSSNTHTQFSTVPLLCSLPRNESNYSELPLFDYPNRIDLHCIVTIKRSESRERKTLLNTASVHSSLIQQTIINTEPFSAWRQHSPNNSEHKCSFAFCRSKGDVSLMIKHSV